MADVRHESLPVTTIDMDVQLSVLEAEQQLLPSVVRDQGHQIVEAFGMVGSLSYLLSQCPVPNDARSFMREEQMALTLLQAANVDLNIDRYRHLQPLQPPHVDQVQANAKNRLDTIQQTVIEKRIGDSRSVTEPMTPNTAVDEKPAPTSTDSVSEALPISELVSTRVLKPEYAVVDQSKMNFDIAVRLQATNEMIVSDANQSDQLIRVAALPISSMLQHSFQASKHQQTMPEALTIEANHLLPLASGSNLEAPGAHTALVPPPTAELLPQSIVDISAEMATLYESFISPDTEVNQDMTEILNVLTIEQTDMIAAILERDAVAAGETWHMLYPEEVPLELPQPRDVPLVAQEALFAPVSLSHMESAPSHQYNHQLDPYASLMLVTEALPERLQQQLLTAETELEPLIVERLYVVMDELTQTAVELHRLFSATSDQEYMAEFEADKLADRMKLLDELLDARYQELHAILQKNETASDGSQFTLFLDEGMKEFKRKLSTQVHQLPALLQRTVNLARYIMSLGTQMQIA